MKRVETGSKAAELLAVDQHATAIDEIIKNLFTAHRKLAQNADRICICDFLKLTKKLDKIVRKRQQLLLVDSYGDYQHPPNIFAFHKSRELLIP